MKAQIRIINKITGSAIDEVFTLNNVDKNTLYFELSNRPKYRLRTKDDGTLGNKRI
jgi:hypothetical protein